MKHRRSRSTASAGKVYRRFARDRALVLYHGDCLKLLKSLPNNSIDITITSPPYFMGKSESRTSRMEHFEDLHKNVLPEIVRVTKPTGSVCWQVGYHVTRNGSVTPLDYTVFDIARSHSLVLRNRIIWTYGHGLHGYKRFSGRHETVLWFTIPGEKYFFNLDDVRVPQKYPGKRHYRGSKKGQYSGNPKGKNPEDVWHIPNVKAHHVEKTEHPCQFPFALAQRLIRALCPAKGTVMDPFAGSGTTGAAAVLEKRKFVGAEIEQCYWDVANERLKQATRGTLSYRSINTPIFVPTNGLSVARRPAHFLTLPECESSEQ